jgi:predicted nuclease of restriction endonuclease-like (RecB) superfamily
MNIEDGSSTIPLRQPVPFALVRLRPTAFRQAPGSAILSMRPRLCGRGGLSGSLTARSAANSTNASRSRRTKPPCWRKLRTAEPGDLVTPEEAIKDPFVLEFLDLKDEYSESDLEEALIQHLTDFLLELGDDFAFLGRQRRLRIDDNWFRIDLVFFHRRLRPWSSWISKWISSVYADAGQMHLYLNYAREHWMKPGENPPVGLILCAEKGAAEAHYALDNLPNKVLAAEYQTVLPDEKLIAEELERSRRELELTNFQAGDSVPYGPRELETLSAPDTPRTPLPRPNALPLGTIRLPRQRCCDSQPHRPLVQLSRDPQGLQVEAGC